MTVMAIGRQWPMAVGLTMLIMLTVFLFIGYHTQCDGLQETFRFPDNYLKPSPPSYSASYTSVSSSEFTSVQQDIYSPKSYCGSITIYTINMMTYGLLVPVVLFAQV